MGLLTTMAAEDADRETEKEKEDDCTDYWEGDVDGEGCHGG